MQGRSHETFFATRRTCLDKNRNAARKLTIFRAFCSVFVRRARRRRAPSRSHRAQSRRRCASNAPSSSRMRVPAAGSRKFSVPTATQLAPAAMKSSASRPLSMPPIPITGTPHPRGNARRSSRAPPPNRRSGQAAARRSEPRACRSRDRSASASQRVDQRDRIGAAALGGRRDRRGVGRRWVSASRSAACACRGVRRSISAAVSPGSEPITQPDLTFGQETFSSSAATSGPLDHLDERRELLVAKNRPRSRSEGTGRVASSGRSCSRKPLSPLFGSPIELIMPAGVSHRRGGGFPPAGLERDRLGDEGGERKAPAQLVPEGPQRRDRVEGAGTVQDRMRELE